VLEVMGRHVGHIAVWSGLAGGATVVLVPEEPFDIADVAARITARHDAGRWATVVVVAEGARPRPGSIDLQPAEHDRYGHVRLGGIGNLVAAEIQERTGIETRTTILGYVQRGGSPNAYDRVLASRFGVAAADAVADRAFGTMVALQADRIVRVPVTAAVEGLKVVAPDLLRDAALFQAPPAPGPVSEG
jgi:6-phosphofructokinase 1